MDGWLIELKPEDIFEKDTCIYQTTTLYKLLVNFNNDWLKPL